MCLNPSGKHYPPLFFWKSRLPSLSLQKPIKQKSQLRNYPNGMPYRANIAVYPLRTIQALSFNL